MDRVPVKDNRGLVRDMHSKAIINIDSSAYLRAKERKNMRRKIVSQESEIEHMRRELAELKSVMREIINSRV